MSRPPVYVPPQQAPPPPSDADRFAGIAALVLAVIGWWSECSR
jgi:hypothetical protein